MPTNPSITPSVSVIVPAMNEARNLPHVLPMIPTWVDEVILVDGNSTDDTVEVAQSLIPNVRVIPQRGKGKGAALRTGFAAARGDIIVMLDADGSTDPREIPAFVEQLVKGADFVKGSRFLKGGGTDDMPLYRKLGNASFVAAVRLLFGGGYTDLCYGYNAFWSWVVPVLDLNCSGFEVETMMNVRALRAGLTVGEVPSFEHQRVYGVSNLHTIRDGMRVLRTIVRERLRPAPMQVTPGVTTRVAAIVPIRPMVATVPVETGRETAEQAFADATQVTSIDRVAIG